MRKLIFCLLIVSSFNVKSQTFSLTDSTFQVGDSLVRHLDWYYNQSSIPTNTELTLDSISTFLITNSSIKIEISCHTDSRGAVDYNLKLTEGRALVIEKHQIKKGITSNRLTTKGYGESALIYTDEEINSKPTEEEREELHAKNRRTVFKIIAL